MEVLDGKKRKKVFCLYEHPETTKGQTFLRSDLVYR